MDQDYDFNNHQLDRLTIRSLLDQNDGLSISTDEMLPNSTNYLSEFIDKFDDVRDDICDKLLEIHDRIYILMNEYKTPAMNKYEYGCFQEKAKDGTNGMDFWLNVKKLLPNNKQAFNTPNQRRRHVADCSDIINSQHWNLLDFSKNYKAYDLEWSQDLVYCLEQDENTILKSSVVAEFYSFSYRTSRGQERSRYVLLVTLTNVKTLTTEQSQPTESNNKLLKATVREIKSEISNLNLENTLNEMRSEMKTMSEEYKKVDEKLYSCYEDKLSGDHMNALTDQIMSASAVLNKEINYLKDLEKPNPIDLSPVTNLVNKISENSQKDKILITELKNQQKSLNDKVKTLLQQVNTIKNQNNSPPINFKELQDTLDLLKRKGHRNLKMWKVNLKTSSTIDQQLKDIDIIDDIHQLTKSSELSTFRFSSYSSFFELKREFEKKGLVVLKLKNYIQSTDNIFGLPTKDIDRTPTIKKRLILHEVKNITSVIKDIQEMVSKMNDITLGKINYFKWSSTTTAQDYLVILTLQSSEYSKIYKLTYHDLLGKTMAKMFRPKYWSKKLQSIKFKAEKMFTHNPMSPQDPSNKILMARQGNDFTGFNLNYGGQQPWYCYSSPYMVPLADAVLNSGNGQVGNTRLHNRNKVAKK